MTFLSGLRLVMFTAAFVLSLANLCASALENSRTTPNFHYPMFMFPFTLSVITVVFIPAITIIERRTWNKEGRVRLISSVTVELSLLVIFFFLWFACALTGVLEFFGPFHRCHKGRGVGVVAAGLDVPSHCKIVAVVHGTSWLTCLAFLAISAFAGVSAILALRQGSNVSHLRLIELSITGHPISDGEKELL